MLVNYIDYVVAFDSNTSSGTAYTVNEARKKGKKVVILT